jgi:hypothetical protein
MLHCFKGKESSQAIPIPLLASSDFVTNLKAKFLPNLNWVAVTLILTAAICFQKALGIQIKLVDILFACNQTKIL